MNISDEDVLGEAERIVEIDIQIFAIVFAVHQQKIANLCVLNSLVLKIDMAIFADEASEGSNFGDFSADVFFDELLLREGGNDVAENQHAGDLHALEEANCVKSKEMRVQVLLKHRFPLSLQPNPSDALAHQSSPLYNHTLSLQLLSI